jgi:flagellar hook-basal body complex protein FliE
MIPTVANITPIAIPELSPSASPAGKPGEFQNVLANAIGTMESLNHSAADSAQQFMTGENDELHTTVLATQKASLAFELGMAVRNKVVEAYQEVMKMQL